MRLPGLPARLGFAWLAACKTLGMPRLSLSLAEAALAGSSAQTTIPRLRQALFHYGPPISRETVLCGACRSGNIGAV